MYLKIPLLFSLALLLSCHRDTPAVIEPNPVEPSVEFQKSYGGTGDEFGSAVVETANGDFIIVGTTTTTVSGDRDVYIVRTNSNGKVIWNKTFGGINNDDGKEICAAADGNFLVLANTASGGAGGVDISLLKIDGQGNLIWQKYFGGTANETGEDILQTTDGNYIINGMTTSFGKGARDIYIIKVNDNGDLIWSKTFGDAGEDGGMSLCNAADGNVMLFNFTDNYGAINRDWYVIEINSKGDSLTSALLGGDGYEEPQSIEPTTTGNFLLVGHTGSFGHPEHNLFAAEIDKNAKLIWQKNYGGSQHDGGEHGKQSADGGYILAGLTMSFQNAEQMYLVKTAPNGEKVWEKNFGYEGNEWAYNMIETASAYILVGYTKNVNKTDYDLFLVKTFK